MINARTGIWFGRGNQKKIGFRERPTRIIGEGRTGVGTEFIFEIGLFNVRRGCMEALVLGRKIGGSEERNEN